MTLIDSSNSERRALLNLDALPPFGVKPIRVEEPEVHAVYQVWNLKTDDPIGEPFDDRSEAFKRMDELNERVLAKIPVLKVGYNYGAGWLICHGTDYEAAGATEEQRLGRVRSEASDFVLEDVDTSDNYLVELSVVAKDKPAAVAVTCLSRAQLETWLPFMVRGVGENVAAVAKDSDGGEWTISAEEMTRMECYELPEFDGW